ncbi:MAG: LPS biosynthesis protein, partial [Actinomycetota bacterium]
MTSSMAAAEFRICTHCVMDTTDPDITFDEHGVCNHCRSYPILMRTFVSSAAERDNRLRRLVDRIKSAGKKRDYDCVIGLSGGVDSSYVAFLAKRTLGL